MHWYDDMPHIGYSMEGKKVFRPAKGDELDRFLATVEDPTSWCGPHIVLYRGWLTATQDVCLRQVLAVGQTSDG